MAGSGASWCRLANIVEEALHLVARQLGDRQFAETQAWAKIKEVTEGADPRKETWAEKAAARARKLSTVTTLIEAYLEDAARGRHRPNARPKRPSSLALERFYFNRLIARRTGRRLTPPRSTAGRHG